MDDVVLRVENLKMHFPVYKGAILRRRVGTVKAVDGVDLSLGKGETLGLVGESGCGKSTLGRTIMRLYEPSGGRIEVAGTDITRLSFRELLASRKHFQMIFQDPYASLNPRMSVFDIIAEPLRTLGLARGRAELVSQVAKLSDMVGLAGTTRGKYPHEFSGGQRQRIAIARALAVRPRLLICDEPLSALDVSIQAQILNLLAALQKELGLAYLFIAHDLSAVRYLSQQVAVMYLGKIVEVAPTETLFKSPRHPYTQALLSAVPLADPKAERTRTRILLQGDLPSPLAPPTGCAFHTRCPMADTNCQTMTPTLQTVGKDHRAACLQLHDEHQA